jgi:hypothetical protein
LEAREEGIRNKEIESGGGILRDERRERGIGRVTEMRPRIICDHIVMEDGAR